MQPIERIQTFAQVKTLADPQRMSILRMLMASPATITHLGRALGKHPAWVRHHVRLLEQVGLVEMSRVQKTGGYLEKFYQAAAGAFLIQETILPDFGSPAIVVAGSHDLALELLARQPAQLYVIVLPLGSVDGLMTLRQGMCNASGCHLFDAQSGEYNLSYVRHFFPDRPMKVITLSYREQGLLVASGNPLRIRGLVDLTRTDITFINRNRGSGTRLWLDEQLHHLGIGAQRVNGYKSEVNTHTEVANAILCSKANAGLGIRAAAQAHGLDFIPLFNERYDLVFPQEQMSNTNLVALVNHLNSSAFRHQAAALGGYDMTHTGETLAT